MGPKPQPRHRPTVSPPRRALPHARKNTAPPARAAAVPPPPPPHLPPHRCRPQTGGPWAFWCLSWWRAYRLSSARTAWKCTARSWRRTLGARPTSARCAAAGGWRRGSRGTNLPASTAAGGQPLRSQGSSKGALAPEPPRRRGSPHALALPAPARYRHCGACTPPLRAALPALPPPPRPAARRRSCRTLSGACWSAGPCCAWVCRPAAPTISSATPGLPALTGPRSRRAPSRRPTCPRCVRGAGWRGGWRGLGGEGERF
jgi:hypothetical protein